MFTKLFSSITTSSIWNEDNNTRIVWVTMLAMANKHGYVSASVGGLAHESRVSREDCESALKVLTSPDEDSRSKEFEGRRVEIVDGGFQLLNYPKYRAMRSEEERKEYMKEYMVEYRKKTKLTKIVNKNVNNVSECKPPLAQAEAEADTDKNKEASAKASAPSMRIPIEAKEVIIPEKFQTDRFCEIWAQWIAFRKKGKRSGNWRLFFKEELDKISDLSEPQAFDAVKNAFKSGWQNLYQPKEIKKEVKRKTYEELMNENASTKS